MRQDLYRDLYTQEEKHWWHISKRNSVKELLRTFLNKQNLKILDIGCGTGKTMDMLSCFGNVWGIDNNKKALSFCRKRGLHNLILADASNTGFKDNFFDIVAMLDVLEHTDENTTLQETKRVLKRGGFIALSRQ